MLGAAVSVPVVDRAAMLRSARRHTARLMAEAGRFGAARHNKIFQWRQVFIELIQLPAQLKGAFGFNQLVVG